MECDHMTCEEINELIFERDNLKKETEHLRMQIGYITAELQIAGDKRSTPEIVETAAKATASQS